MEFYNRIYNWNADVHQTMIKTILQLTKLPKVLVNIIDEYDTGVRGPLIKEDKFCFKIVGGQDEIKLVGVGPLGFVFNLKDKILRFTQGFTNDLSIMHHFDYILELKNVNNSKKMIKKLNLNTFALNELLINDVFYFSFQYYTIPKLTFFHNIGEDEFEELRKRQKI